LKEVNTKNGFELVRNTKDYMNVKTNLRLLARLALLMAASVPQVEASNFLHGNLTWTSDGPPRHVAFQFSAAFRRSDYAGTASDGHPQPGDLILDSLNPTQLDFGDGTTIGALRFRVTQTNLYDDFIVGVAQDPLALDPLSSSTSIRHRYNSRGPFIAAVHGSARLANLNNRSGSDFRLQTLVKLNTRNAAPVSTVLPIVTVLAGTNVTFPVPAIDANGDRLQWRLATDSEAGGGPSPPNFTVDANTGVVSWNNQGLNASIYWTAQIIIEDLDTRGNVRGINPVDFLLRIVPGTNPPLLCLVSPPGPFTVNVGTPVSFTVAGTNWDLADPLTLHSTFTPAGSSLTPPLPLTGTSGVSSAFSWIPSADQSGPYVILFSVTDTNNLAAQSVVYFDVTETLRVVESTADCAADTVTVAFNRPVQLGGSFGLDRGAVVLSTSYGASSNQLVLTTSALAPAIDYTLTISGVHDLANPTNTLTPDPTLQVINCSDSCGPLVVSASLGGMVLLDWSGTTAVLQSSTNLATWVDMTNAQPPYALTPGAPARQFFRLRCAGASNGGLAPTISSQPKSVIAAVGDTVFFSAEATGSSPLHYQWFFNGTILPGATGDTLILLNVTNLEIGAYELVVSNAHGTTLSQPAWLILTNNTDGLRFNTLYSAPAVSVLLVGVDNTAGLPLNTTVAQPPLFVNLLGTNNTAGLPLNTTIAQPSVSVLLLGTANLGGLPWNTTVAQPPVQIHPLSP
jgi:hypothetical protein